MDSDFDPSGGFLGSNSGIEESSNLWAEDNGYESNAGSSDEFDNGYIDPTTGAYVDTGTFETQPYVDTNLADWADPAPTADNPYGF